MIPPHRPLQPESKIAVLHYQLDQQMHLRRSLRRKKLQPHSHHHSFLNHMFQAVDLLRTR